MSEIFESQLNSMDKNSIRIICPFFNYPKTPTFELFLNGEKELFIKLDCHNHILPIEEYFNYYFQNIQKLKKDNNCKYHHDNNKYISFCLKCSTELCQNCLKDNHSGHYTSSYSKGLPKKETIENEHEKLLNLIKLLNAKIAQQKENKFLDEKYNNNLMTIKYIFMILNIAFIEYSNELSEDNLSIGCINNLTYCISKNSYKNLSFENKKKLDNIAKIFNLHKFKNKEYLVNNGIFIDENKSSNCLNSQTINLEKTIDLKAANSLYFITYDDEETLDIYLFQNLQTIHNIKDVEKIKLVRFHLDYLNVFLTASEKSIKIWEIKENNCEVKIQINNKDKYILYDVQFIPENPDSILIIDKDGIKVWNLENIYYTITINVNSRIIYSIFSDNGKLFGCYDKKYINLYKVEDGTNIKSFGEKCKHFYIRSKEKNYNLILINEKSIKYNHSISSKDFYTIDFPDFIRNSFYDNKYDFLYLFSKCLIVIKIENWSKVLEINIEIFDYVISSFKNDSFIISQIISSGKQTETIRKHSFISTILYNCDNQKENKISDDKFWDKKIKYLKNYNQEFSFNSNLISKDEIFEKKYFKFLNIEQIVKDNYIYSLSMKKNMAIKELDEFKFKGNLIEQYKNLILIMIKDNTYENLLKVYLGFLKANKENLTNIENIDSYDEEIKYYSVFFTQDELWNDFGYTKEKNEKDRFLYLLKEFSGKNFEKEDYGNFLSRFQISEENLSTFNQPIDFKNKELYFYTCRAIISIEILKIKGNTDKIKRLQSTINIVLKRELFYNNNIINDEKKFSKLILIILRKQTDFIT